MEGISGNTKILPLCGWGKFRSIGDLYDSHIILITKKGLVF